MSDRKKEIVVMGGGLTGLSAGYVLAKNGFRVRVFERDSTVGGLSKTVVSGSYRFDLGGHRFFTKDKKVENFVKDLMDGEMISVHRTSKIYMRNRYFDYPLRPFNAMFGLGVPVTARIMTDYAGERIKRLIRDTEKISLEDWVVSNFGRTMFNIYFKEYSEKVWGIDCSRISADWVAQRIRGLSLSTAVKNAFFKFSGRDIPTLADNFMYPELGIGRISDRLREEIEKENEVHTDTSIIRINHSGSKIKSVIVKDETGTGEITGDEFISSMPLTNLVKMLNPAPPENIIETACKLKFRDIVIVAIMVNRKRVTDQSWIYIPEKKIPFGRIHEPVNWSVKMVPEGKTVMVMEYFSFKGDHIWSDTDAHLTDMTVSNLEDLGFIRRHEVIDSFIVRASSAYPLFEIGYKDLCLEIYDYLSRFKNLHLSGRAGLFRYYNMDHAIESGMNTAESIIKDMSQDSEKMIQSEKPDSCDVTDILEGAGRC